MTGVSRLAAECNTARNKSEMLLSPDHMQETHTRHAGEVAQRLNTPAALAGNLGSVPSTHLRKLKSTVTPVLGELPDSFRQLYSLIHMDGWVDE